MRDYRVRIRAERVSFFEELMRSLDFCDYERDESGVELITQQVLETPQQRERKTPIIKSQERKRKGIDASRLFQENLDNLREAMLKIEVLPELGLPTRATVIVFESFC